MADGVFVERWKVFLASPGDVGEERAFVRDFLQNVLPHKPLLHGRLMFELVSWDDPHSGTTMPAHLTPQQAVGRFHGEPAECQLVIVILWSRLGTHLDVSHDCKPDGSAFLSGTEWEYLNAFNAPRRPEILVYRRIDEPQVGMDDPALDEKRRQRQMVGQFFQRFSNLDESARGSFQPYQGVEGFRQQLVADLERLAAEHLMGRDTPPATPLPLAKPEPTPVLPPARCLGREGEARTLIDALVAPGTASLLVLGPAGIGKTTLTRRVATDPAVAARFGPRRFFVPLETATDATALRTAIIQAIGLSPATTNFTAVLSVLSELPTLLVLDNLETPWEQDQRAAQDVLLALANTPNVSLLASLRGNTAPASPNWTHPPTRLPKLPDDAARHLFLTLAPEAAKDPADLAYFLAALGGVPLALELVAIRAGETNLAELWAEWGRRGIALAQHPDQDPGRLTSLGRSLDLSWESRRLREPGRCLFRLLGALPAGMADADRIAMLGDDAAEAARQVRAVGLAFNQDGRLDLLPPVRDYARSAHSPQDGESVLWCRHYLALTRDIGGLILATEGAAALARLAPEVANAEAALLAAETTSLRGEAVSALDGVSRLLSATGAGSLMPLTTLAMACHAAADSAGEAECQFANGRIAFNRSQHDAARAAYQQALLLYRQVDDLLGQANCIYRLGDIALRHTEHKTARTAFEKALPLYRQVNNISGEADCIQRLGDIALDRSEFDAARAKYNEALPLYQQATDQLGEAICIQRLADIELAHSRYDAAQTTFETAQQLYQRIGALRGEASCILGLGDIALACSQYDNARMAYEQALPFFRQVGSVVGVGNYYLRLGRLKRTLGDLDAARACYGEALVLFRQVRASLNVARTLTELVRVTVGEEQAQHIKTARAAWIAINLPDEAARLDRAFG